MDERVRREVRQRSDWLVRERARQRVRERTNSRRRGLSQLNEAAAEPQQQQTLTVCIHHLWIVIHLLLLVASLSTSISLKHPCVTRFYNHVIGHQNGQEEKGKKAKDRASCASTNHRQYFGRRSIATSPGVFGWRIVASYEPYAYAY